MVVTFLPTISKSLLLQWLSNTTDLGAKFRSKTALATQCKSLLKCEPGNNSEAVHKLIHYSKDWFHRHQLGEMDLH